MNKACVVDISIKQNTGMKLTQLEQSDFIPQVLAVKSDNDSSLSTSLSVALIISLSQKSLK